MKASSNTVGQNREETSCDAGGVVVDTTLEGGDSRREMD